MKTEAEMLIISLMSVCSQSPEIQMGFLFSISFPLVEDYIVVVCRQFLSLPPFLPINLMKTEAELLINFLWRVGNQNGNGVAAMLVYHTKKKVTDVCCRVHQPCRNDVT